MKENFICDLLNIPWQRIETINDPNLAWKAWENNCNEVIDRHAPLRLQRIRHTAIKKMMRNRDYHKKQSVKYGSEYHWRLY